MVSGAVPRKQAQRMPNSASPVPARGAGLLSPIAIAPVDLFDQVATRVHVSDERNTHETCFTCHGRQSPRLISGYASFRSERRRRVRTPAFDEVGVDTAEPLDVDCPAAVGDGSE